MTEHPPLGTVFLAAIRDRFSDAHSRLGTVLSRLDGPETAWRANASSNSIGNLVLHLCGHLEAGYLGAAAVRDRPAEFLTTGPFDPHALRAYADRTFMALDAHLGRLNADDLAASGPHGGPEPPLLRSLVYSLGHTTEHVGQVIVLAKAQRPDAIGHLWGTPVRLAHRDARQGADDRPL